MNCVVFLWFEFWGSNSIKVLLSACFLFEFYPFLQQKPSDGNVVALNGIMVLVPTNELLLNCLQNEWSRPQLNLNRSALLFKHRTMTKLAGWIWVKAGRILQVLRSEARFNALSIETLSIIATSSGVYSLTWQRNRNLNLSYGDCFN